MFLVESRGSTLVKDNDVQVTPRFGPPFLVFPPLGSYRIHGVPVVWHARNTRSYSYGQKRRLLFG